MRATLAHCANEGMWFSRNCFFRIMWATSMPARVAVAKWTAWGSQTGHTSDQATPLRACMIADMSAPSFLDVGANPDCHITTLSKASFLRPPNSDLEPLLLEHVSA